MIWKSPNGQLLYRVGDVMISTNSQNPSAFFGGTWQLLCPGRTLVCVDTNDNDFNNVKKQVGEDTCSYCCRNATTYSYTKRTYS